MSGQRLRTPEEQAIAQELMGRFPYLIGRPEFEPLVQKTLNERYPKAVVKADFENETFSCKEGILTLKKPCRVESRGGEITLIPVPTPFVSGGAK